MKSGNIRMAIKVSLIVGTILNIINNYPVFVHSDYTIPNMLRVSFTFLVPFLVSLYSSTFTKK